MTDLIKRDDALALVEQWFDTDNHLYSIILNDITNLPAVNPAAIRKAAMLDAGYDTPVDPVVNDPPDWIWYGEDNDGKIHTSLGRWQKHLCQVRYKLAEIQPTEHDHPIDPAAIREAALREAAAEAERTPTCLLPSGHFLSERCRDAILALIGEAK